MKYLVKRRKQMSLKTELACLSLLVLILLQLETPSLAAGNEKSTTVKAAPTKASEFNPAKPQVGGFKRNAEKDGNDEIFGADKRTIYTGPNPLHNR
ncbi:hypothetical protein PRUPE_7G031000 [Prunus persica]|uniref:Uncharacterized protein n=1 Tax=Prunus persica TaxID=3760 RepID=M5VU75_PRUPE|nr:hypothetical protein PRUPE_7G031000 [Prunus persica]